MRTELAKKLLEVFTSNHYRLEYVYANSEKGLIMTFRDKATHDLVEWGIDGDFIKIERDGFYKPIQPEEWSKELYSLRLDSINRCELQLRDDAIVFKGFRKGLSFFKFAFNIEPSDNDNEIQGSLLNYIMNGNEIDYVFSIDKSIYRLFDSMVMIGAFIGKRLIDRVYLAAYDNNLTTETKNEEQHEESRDQQKSKKKVIICYQGESPDDIREGLSPLFDIGEFKIEEVSQPFLAFSIKDFYIKNPAADLLGWNELSVYFYDSKYYAISSFDEGVFARAIPAYTDIKLYTADMQIQEKAFVAEGSSITNDENNDSEASAESVEQNTI